MRYLRTLTAALAACAFVGPAFAGGDGGGSEPSPAGTPTSQEKSDSKAVLDLFGVEDDKPETPKAQPGTTVPVRIVSLSDNEFSTTAKLKGNATSWDTLNEIGYGVQEDPFPAGSTPRSRLNFDTSFTGEDRLRTRLVDRDLTRPENIGALFGGAPDPNDYVFEMPILSANEPPTASNQPVKISTVVRDDQAVGFQVGFKGAFGTYQFESNADFVTYSYSDLPDTGVEIEISAAAAPPSFEFFTFESGYGSATLQTNQTGGPAYPDLFNGGIVEGILPSWPQAAPTEGFYYKFPTNKEITITPGLINLFNPSENSDDAIVGTLRTTFRF